MKHMLFRGDEMEWAALTPEQKVEWLNERDPLNQWKLGQRIFCLHCDRSFKAEEISFYVDSGDGELLPECPHCAFNCIRNEPHLTQLTMKHRKELSQGVCLG